MRPTRRLLSATLFGVASLGALALPAGAQEKPARVYAASSLTDAMNRIGDLYAATGRPRPVFVFAASSTLARQIDQGAPADVFISADEAWMDYLETRKRIVAATRKDALANRLVLVAPADRPFRLAIRKGMDLAGALGGGRLAMADPVSVPAGKYGKAALESLGVWPQVERSVVRAENVRAALLFVERGEAAGGIVYLTDQIIAKDKVALVGVFPADTHKPISYPLAAVKGGRPETASDFLAFLETAEARAVFTGLGFSLS